MPKVPCPYEVYGKFVTENGSLVPICSLSNSSLMPNFTVFSFLSPNFSFKFYFFIKVLTFQYVQLLSAIFKIPIKIYIFSELHSILQQQFHMKYQVMRVGLSLFAECFYI